MVKNMKKRIRFKETEIGMIPEDWKLKSLDQVAVFKNGKKPSKRKSNGIYLIYGSNGPIGFSNEFNSKENSLIIGRVGAYCGNVYFSKAKSWITDNAIIGQTLNNNSSLFFFYKLKQLELNRYRNGAAQPLINQSILYSLKASFPNYSEQKQIAKILSDLDSKIENLQKQNKILEQITQTVFKSWFVDFDGQTEFVDSELGKIPKGWEVVKLGIHTKIKGRIGWKGLTQSEYSDEGYHLVTGKQLVHGIIDWDDCPRVSKERYLESPEIMLKKNDILMSKDGTIGRLAFIFKLNEPSSVGTGIFVIRPNSEIIDHYFLLSFFKSDIFKSIVYSRTEGSVIPHLYQRDIIDFDLVLAPKSIIDKFINISKNITSLQYTNILQIQNLTKTRDSLLPKLMSGDLVN